VPPTAGRRWSHRGPLRGERERRSPDGGRLLYALPRDLRRPRFARPLYLLGLLIELVADDGEFVPTTTYEEVRKERLSAGEEWPAASTLSRLYGHWLAAVRAACRFWFDGGPQRVASNHHHAAGTQPGYKPAEILSTLLAARRDLELPDGHWPSQREYSEWAEVKRRLTRRSGKAPRIPGLKQIRKAFAGYDSAVSAASRHFDDPR